MADLGWTELNEAFAAQALAVMRQLEMDPAKVNRSAARSRSAIRSAPPARSAPRPDGGDAARPRPALRHDQHVHRHWHGRGGVFERV